MITVGLLTTIYTFVRLTGCNVVFLSFCFSVKLLDYEVVKL